VGERDIGGVGMNKFITLYPANWLYNAAVIGFLRVIAYGKGEEVIDKWLSDNGTVTIERGIFSESVAFYKGYNKHKGEKELPLVGKNKRYPNYLQSGEESAFEDYSKNLSNIKEEGIACGICSRNFSIDFSQFNDKTKKIAERITSNIQVIHNSLIGPSKGEFPNSFWNLNYSISICPLCAYLIIHHHIPFESAQTQNGQIFINAPSFKIMWHLNKFVEQIFSKSKGYQVRQILGISFIELAQKVAVTLGAWSIMNIEMVIKRGNEIEYYSLPYEISRLLLQKDIASLISATKEPLILEIILNGKFSHLLTLSHKILRYSITETNAFNDKYLSQLRNKDTKSLKILSNILPELYTRINSIISREVMI